MNLHKNRHLTERTNSPYMGIWVYIPFYILPLEWFALLKTWVSMCTVQVTWNVRLQRKLAALHIIRLRFISFHFWLNFLLGHAVDEVSVSEVPADRLWFLCFQNLLHHCWPAPMLLRDYHLVYVQNYNVLESEIYIYQQLMKNFLRIIDGMKLFKTIFSSK